MKPDELDPSSLGPSAWAWRLGMGGLVPFLGLAALLWACLAVDRVLYPGHRLRTWLPMRFWLTVVASLACLAGAAALSR